MARRPHHLGERLGTDHDLDVGDVIGAVDVGSNAVRLKLVRVLGDGAFEHLHQERDPVRPGEGIWDSGAMSPAVMARLVGALSRYADVCRAYGARHVRAVATSALREAKNRDQVITLVREACDLDLEIITGREEARLIGLGVLRGLPAPSRSLLIDIGGGSTEIVRGEGENPVELCSIPIGAVRLTEIFGSPEKLKREALVSMRRFAQRVVAGALPPRLKSTTSHAMGSSGTIRAVCAFAAGPGSAHATRENLSRAVEELVSLSPTARRKRFDAQRAEVIVAGAVILESVAHHLRLDSVTAVDGGLKEGLLVDLLRRADARSSDPLLSTALLEVGRRFSFDEAHAMHTRDVSLALFDALTDVHHLPAESRLILEVASVLHDVGYVVSASRHHKHSMYVISNMDLPGISERERHLASLVARFHRRSPPSRSHPALAGLDATERRVTRGLAALLRIADASDQSRLQAVDSVSAVIGDGVTSLVFRPKAGRALPRWDLEGGQRALFRSCFGTRLDVRIMRARPAKTTKVATTSQPKPAARSKR
jgi:exopolyphosphatase/guanosine-5'-triphosphate,3'-diphosphate pyrophosphatase